MNKRTIIFFLFLFSALCGYSQVSWHTKAGINFSRATESDSDLKLGYQFGIGIDSYFNDHWGIQPSLILISKGYKKKGEYFDYESPLSKYNMTENRIYIEIPIMLTYRFNLSNTLKLVLSGGGYASYGIGGKNKNTITSLKDEFKYKESHNTFSDSDGTDRFDTGLSTGTTFEYKNRYTIGLIGEWGLTSNIGNFSKNQTYGLNVGYKF